ncbi:MAG: hypothetical protein KF752_09310 [Pirellulaceae bacterium]|nr:hypothetical protein [Pirellulaceae bacterium]
MKLKAKPRLLASGFHRCLHLNFLKNIDVIFYSNIHVGQILVAVVDGEMRDGRRFNHASYPDHPGDSVICT